MRGLRLVDPIPYVRGLSDVDRTAATPRFVEMAGEPNPDGCLLWPHSRNRKGYGQFRWRGRLFIASRFAWMLFRGEIPAGVMVLHPCDNPPCVNVDHLFLGTNSDNQRDSSINGRHWMKKHPEMTTLNRGDLHVCPRGEQCRAARLTASTVREIRDLKRAGRTARELSERFGIGQGHVYKITSGNAWKHVA